MKVEASVEECRLDTNFLLCNISRLKMRSDVDGEGGTKIPMPPQPTLHLPASSEKAGGGEV